MAVVEKTQYKGFQIKVVVDDEPCNPTQEYDNLGHIALYGHEYNFGDENGLTQSDIEAIESNPELISLPIYAYIHSGMTINTTGFSCPWDSGQIGVVYVSKEQIRQEYSRKRITEKCINFVENQLQSEIEILDRYLTGRVYGYQIINKTGNKIIDSCYGFFCPSEDVKSEAKAIVDNIVKTEKIEKIKKFEALSQIPLPY